MIHLTVPLRLQSAANLHEPWYARHRRVKSERAAVTMFLGGKPRPAFPLTVTLTRIAPRALDSDNNVAAMKAPRDAVAAWLGVADNHPGIEWQYAQRRGAPREYAIEVRIESRVEASVRGVGL